MGCLGGTWPLVSAIAGGAACAAAVMLSTGLATLGLMQTPL